MGLNKSVIGLSKSIFISTIEFLIKFRVYRWIQNLKFLFHSRVMRYDSFFAKNTMTQIWLIMYTIYTPHMIANFMSDSMIQQFLRFVHANFLREFHSKMRGRNKNFVFKFEFSVKFHVEWYVLIWCIFRITFYWTKRFTPTQSLFSCESSVKSL